jgi:hypothetical protein
VELLEDEADAGGPQRGQARVREPLNAVAGDLHGAAAGAVEGAQDVQHRGLPGAGGSDDRDQFPSVDPDADAGEGRHAAGVSLGDLVAGDHDGITTTVPSVMPSPATSTRPSANIPVSTST